VDDIPALRAKRDKLADQLGDADQELHAAMARVEQLDWQLERAHAKHSENVVNLAKQLREQRFPNWSASPQDGGTVDFLAGSGSGYCTVLDSLLDEAEETLAAEAPEGFTPVKRQGPDAKAQTMPIPAKGYGKPLTVSA
jgi:hypothetical protein